MPLFAFGSNGSGQLGVGHVEDVSAPTRCLFLSDDHDPDPGHVLRIVAGGNHTVILLDSGAVYAAGCNDDARCGQFPSIPWAAEGGANSQSFHPTPPRLQSGSGIGTGTGGLQLDFRRIVLHDDGKVINKFRAVSATWEATFLIPHQEDDDDDRIYVLGTGTKGELGLGPDTTTTTTTESTTSSSASAGPKIVPNFPPRGTQIAALASGMGHTVAVLSNGEVYGWGAARQGQLGQLEIPKKIIWSPEKIDGIEFSAISAACGREFTVITGERDYGDFVILGSDKWNILSGAPRSVKGGSVSASWHGIYVHESDSFIKAWGRSDRGQLPPSNLPPVRDIGVGSEHVVALLRNQTVVAFGWGEHGNCGPETDAQGNVKARWNMIALPDGANARIVGVGAGCATSWIITSSN